MRAVEIEDWVVEVVEWVRWVEVEAVEPKEVVVGESRPLTRLDKLIKSCDWNKDPVGRLLSLLGLMFVMVVGWEDGWLELSWTGFLRIRCWTTGSKTNSPPFFEKCKKGFDMWEHQFCGFFFFFFSFSSNTDRAAWDHHRISRAYLLHSTKERVILRRCWWIR